MTQELKNRIQYLEAMIKQMKDGCDGYCALDECICEKDQRVIDLKEEVVELQSVIAEKNEGLRSLYQFEKSENIRDRDSIALKYLSIGG